MSIELPSPAPASEQPELNPVNHLVVTALIALAGELAALRQIYLDIPSTTRPNWQTIGEYKNDRRLLFLKTARAIQNILQPPPKPNEH